MKGFKTGKKSAQAVLDLATGELASADSNAPPFVRPPWHRARLKKHFHGVTMTVQSHKNTTDINNIVNRYQRTGSLPPGRQGQYGDVTAMQGDLGEVIIRSQEIRETADKFVKEQKSKKAAEKKAAEAVKTEPAEPPKEPPKEAPKPEK